MSRTPGRPAATILPALVAIAALLAPVAALAHAGGEAVIHVPADHIVPGESFPVVGADLGQDAAVAMGLLIAGEVVPLGSVAAGPDGHFEVTLVLPGSVGEGYVQLVAQSTDRSLAGTWVRVGTAVTGSQPLAATVFDWVDPSLLIAAAALLVIALVQLARGRRGKAGKARS